MIRTAAAALTGAWSALRVPLWLRGRRWTELLTPPDDARADAQPPRRVRGAAVYSVKLLAMVPGSPWRNTCLYRSVAECLALRRYGIPAVVRIGVRNGGPGEDPIMAHAWVVTDPAAEPAPPDRMRPFPVRA